MKTLSIEIFLILSTVAGSTIPLLPLLKRKDIPLATRAACLLFAIPIAIFAAYTLAKTIALEAFGHELPKICELTPIYKCTKAENTDAKTYSSGYVPSIALTSVEICGRALTTDRRAWNVDPSQEEYVRKSKEAGETIDTCRLKMGLKSISEADEEQERSRVRALSNTQLCRSSYDSNSMNFGTSVNYKSYVLETLNRGLSVAECKRILGISQSSQNASTTDAAEKRSDEVSINAKADSHQFDSRTGLPLSYVMNRSGNSSNLRSGPGRTFPAIMRLPNNLEVVIQGSAVSESGYLWCEVSLGSGQRGFISSDLIAHSCKLSPTQIQNARRTQEIQQRQAEQLTNEMMGIIGTIIKK